MCSDYCELGRTVRPAAEPRAQRQVARVGKRRARYNLPARSLIAVSYAIPLTARTRIAVSAIPCASSQAAHHTAMASPQRAVCP